MTWTYALFDIRLRLPFRLPMPAAPDGNWDYDVEVRPCPRRAHAAGVSARPCRWRTEPDGWVIAFENHRLGGCEFRCREPERRIVITTSEREEDLAAPLTSAVLALLLCRRGATIWHGTALALGGRAILVAGASGSGKSTLSAALCAAGWALISEDMTVCDDQGLVLPGLQALRVSSAAAVLTGVPVAGLRSVLSEEFTDGKFWLPATRLIGGASREPMPLAAVVVLERREPRPAHSRRLTQSEALAALMGHRFGAGWLPLDVGRDLGAAQRVATTVPASALRMENRLEVLPSVAQDLTEKYLHAHA